MTISELEKLKGIYPDKFINLVINAINNWPTDVKSIEEFNDVAEKFLEGEVTKKNIAAKIKKIFLLDHAWEVESLSQIEDALKLVNKEDVSFAKIVLDIKEQLKKL